MLRNRLRIVHAPYAHSNAPPRHSSLARGLFDGIKSTIGWNGIVTKLFASCAFSATVDAGSAVPHGVFEPTSIERPHRCPNRPPSILTPWKSSETRSC